MARLYKFFIIVFLILFVISFVYGTLTCWIMFVALANKFAVSTAGMNIPVTDFMMPGLSLAVLYASVLLFMIILVLKKSLARQQRFTVRNMITLTVWFFCITTLVHVLHYMSFSGLIDFVASFRLSGFGFTLTPLFWWPFLIAWAVLFIVYISRSEGGETAADAAGNHFNS